MPPAAKHIRRWLQFRVTPNGPLKGTFMSDALRHLLMSPAKINVPCPQPPSTPADGFGLCWRRTSFVDFYQFHNRLYNLCATIKA
jgi:hypothetical protein